MTEFIFGLTTNCPLVLNPLTSNSAFGTAKPQPPAGNNFLLFNGNNFGLFTGDALLLLG